MKLLALQQAKIRLSRARKAVTALKLRPISFADAQEAWVDFLLAANSVYFKLQRGVKKKSANKTWLKGVEDLRETDELLRYIHHARNSEEHGIDSSIGLGAPKLELLKGDAPYVRSPGSALAKFPQGPNRPPLRFKITAGPSRLVPVKDRKGAVVPIPTRHLGQVIPSMSIGELADIVVQHLENVVGEAEKLPQE